MVWADPHALIRGQREAGRGVDLVFCLRTLMPAHTREKDLTKQHGGVCSNARYVSSARIEGPSVSWSTTSPSPSPTIAAVTLSISRMTARLSDLRCG